MSNYIGDIFLGVKMDTKGFNRQLTGVKGLAAKAGLAMATAFSVKALVNFSKQCLELGSDLQEVQNVVDVTFAAMSDKVNKFAQDAAGSYGLSETMAKRYIGTYGAMAKAFGFTERAAYDMSSTLTGLAGDVASFYNISQDEAYTKLKSVFTGETESLKDLGVVMTQTALDQYALANGFGKTTAAMSEGEKVALRYAFVQKQLSAAAGDFSRTSDGWANQVRVLSLQFESLKASIGQGLINILTPVIKAINLLMSKLVAAANAFRDFTSALFGKRSQQQTQIANTGAELNSVADSAVSATDGINATQAAAKKLKRELAGFDQITKLGSEEESGTSAGAQSNTGGLATTSVNTSSLPDEDQISSLTTKYGNLATSIDNLKGKFEGFTTLLSSAGKWVMDNVLTPLGEWTMSELLPSGINTLSSALEFLTTACSFLKPVWDWAWEYLLEPIAKFAGNALVVILERLGEEFKLMTTVLQVLKPVWDWIWKNFFEPIGKFVGDKITQFLDTFIEKMKLVPEGYTALREAIENLPQKIEEIKQKVKQKWDELKANITGKLVDFGARINTKWEDLKGKWESLRNKIQDKTANMKAKVKTKWADLKKQWNELLSHFKDKTVTATLKIKGKVADIKKWFNEKVIDKVNEKIHKIPLLQSVSIPRLAQGGYVRKNTPQLAMIGDNRHYGEIVAPENKLQEMARMAAAGVGGTSPEVISLLKEIVELLKTLDLDVVIDGKSLMSLIVRLINQQTKSTGTCPIKT